MFIEYIPTETLTTQLDKFVKNEVAPLLAEKKTTDRRIKAKKDQANDAVATFLRFLYVALPVFYRDREVNFQDDEFIKNSFLGEKMELMDLAANIGTL